MSTISLLVADDHPVTREGLAMLLQGQPGFSVVGQAGNGQEAVDLFFLLKPNVCLMDFHMPVMSGTTATEEILRRDPQARVLLLSAYDGDEDIYRAMTAGARAYLLKDSPTELILEAIRTVHAGSRYLPSVVTSRLAERIGTVPLTDREFAVLRLLTQGLTNKSIAARCDITEGTVKSHINSLMAKLGVSSRTEAALVALRRGLVRD